MVLRVLSRIRIGPEKRSQKSKSVTLICQGKPLLQLDYYRLRERGARCRQAPRFPGTGSSLDDLGYHTGADRAAAFPDREAQTFIHRYRGYQRHFHLHVVTRHDHLNPFGQFH